MSTSMHSRNQGVTLHIGLSTGPVNNATVTPWAPTWGDFQAQLDHAEIGTKNGAYFTGTEFTNNHRNSKNAEGHTASIFVLDGDSTIGHVKDKTFGAPDPARVHEVLKKHGITHCIYTSHSNGKKGNRYRVVVLADVHRADDLAAHVAWVVHLLHEAGVMLTNVSENGNFANAWYMPRVPDKSALEQFRFYSHHSGKKFPVGEMLVWKKSQPMDDSLFVDSEVKSRGDNPAASVNNALAGGAYSGEKASISKVESALKHRAERLRDKATYNDWQHTTMMIHNWDPTELGVEVALKFGELLGYDRDTYDDELKKTYEQELRDKWDGYDVKDAGSTVTVGTLFYEEEALGWQWAASSDHGFFERVQTAAESIEVDDADGLRELMCDAAKLDTLAIGQIKTKLVSRGVIGKSDFNKALRDARQTMAESSGGGLTPLADTDCCAGVLPQVVNSFNCEQLFPDVQALGNNNGAVPLNTVANWDAVLKYWGVTLRFNEMTRVVEVDDGGRFGLDRNDPEKIFPLLKDGGLRNGLNKNGADELLMSIGFMHPYHPFKEYLHGVVWDGVDRVEHVAETITTPDPEHFRLLLKLWLVSVIAVVFSKKARGVLTFSGAQYVGKTTWLEKLTPQIPDGFKEGVHLALGGFKESDSIAKATTALIVELGEIDTTFKRSEISALKAFLSKGEDEYRQAYGRFARKYPRRTVFAGTVNDTEFLQDRTGNSRFWVVPVDAIDLDAMDAVDNLQLWAQVKGMYDAGEPWLLSREEMATLEEKNEKFRDKPPVVQALEAAFDWDDPDYITHRSTDYDDLDDDLKKYFTIRSSQRIARLIGYDQQWKNGSRAGKDLSHALRQMTGMGEPRSMRVPYADTPRRVWVLPPLLTDSEALNDAFSYML